MLYMFFFFFSSRRRHTRYWRDWSSDVCSSDLPAFMASLPVAGISGTLSERMRRPPARGNVLAKTGTTFQASALSGYVRRRYVFSVLQNGNPVSSFWARRAQDRFATALAAK